MERWLKFKKNDFPFYTCEYFQSRTFLTSIIEYIYLALNLRTRLYRIYLSVFLSIIRDSEIKTSLNINQRESVNNVIKDSFGLKGVVEEEEESEKNHN